MCWCNELLFGVSGCLPRCSQHESPGQSGGPSRSGAGVCPLPTRIAFVVADARYDPEHGAGRQGRCAAPFAYFDRSAFGRTAVPPSLSRARHAPARHLVRKDRRCGPNPRPCWSASGARTPGRRMLWPLARICDGHASVESVGRLPVGYAWVAQGRLRSAESGGPAGAAAGRPAERIRPQLGPAAGPVPICSPASWPRRSG
jgi:hypothetical protein